ncbi:MAG: hypothetical protein RL038_575 [Actinomycetota bacterium]
MSLMLVDIATVYYRAYYSQPEWTAPNGQAANAIRGSLDALSYFIDKYQPQELVTTWDLSWRPEWRVELLPTYKTARVADADEEQMPDTLSDQVDLLRSILQEWQIPCVGLPDYESDDVIAHYARTADQQVLVVTGDRDLFQLVNDALPSKVLYIGTGISKHTTVDGSYIFEKYGITAEQYAEFSVLRGDASDGLPGVAGIGEKTAARLLQEFGDIDSLIAAAKAQDSRIRPKITENLITSLDYLERAKQVVILNRPLELPPTASNWRKNAESPTAIELGLKRHQNAWWSAIDY